MSEDKTALHDITVSKFLADSVAVEPTAIQEEYVRLPADLAYWNELYARAYHRHLTAKVNEKHLNALLRIEHREQLENSVARVTESMVDSAVDTDERLQRAHSERIEAEVEKTRLYGILDAIRAKREMLVSLGAHVRAEMEDDPLVRKAHSDAKRIRNNQ